MNVLRQCGQSDGVETNPVVQYWSIGMRVAKWIGINITRTVP